MGLKQEDERTIKRLLGIEDDETKAISATFERLLTTAQTYLQRVQRSADMHSEVLAVLAALHGDCIREVPPKKRGPGRPRKQPVEA